MNHKRLLLNPPTVPPITDPLGKYWDAPRREDLIFTLLHVHVTQHQFTKLPNYQYTLPTGTYEGKMWRRKIGRHWFLVYYFNLPNNTIDIGIGYFRIQIIK